MKKFMISIGVAIIYIIFSYNISLANSNNLPTFEDLVTSLGTDIIDILSKNLQQGQSYYTINRKHKCNTRI